MKREGIMLAYGFTEKRFNSWPKPVLAQPKLEGDRMRVVFTEGDVEMPSSGLTDRGFAVPHIKEELMKHFTLLHIHELDGELYKHGWPHESIRSVVSRTVYRHEEFRELEYHIFDLVNEQPQWLRIDMLKQLQEDFKHIKIVPTKEVFTLEQLQEEYDSFINQGYEGIILRHKDAPYVRRKVTTMMKLKPNLSDSFTITGWEEEKTLDGILKGVLGSFKLVTDEGQTFNAGSGPTDYQRALLWEHRELLKGCSCKVRFQDYTKVRRVPKMLRMDREWLSSIQRILEG